MRSGIAAGGNWIIDRVKVIDVYPAQDALANILEESSGNGGAPYNLLKDLARLNLGLRLEGIGLVGNDPDGDRILQDCQSSGIGTALLTQAADAPTSYTEVMTVRKSGRRTFFHQRGANRLLQPEHFDFEKVQAQHLHLGYLLLLDGLDGHDDVYGTGAARVLARAKEQGLSTSIDVVSEDSDRFRNTVLPALKFADVVFMNEFELSRTTGISVTTIDDDRLLQAGELLAEGLRGQLVVHTPDRVFAFSPEGKRKEHGSVKMPPDSIQGAVGAGDAFAAGFLAGFIKGQSTEECLRNGVCVAASSLLASDSSSGVLSWDQCMELGRTYSYY